MDNRELELLDELIELIEYKAINKLRKFLENVNSADFPSIFEEITEEQIIMVFRLLPKTKAAEVFVELEPSAQENLINYLTDSEIKNVMNEIYMDDAVDLIEEVKTWAKEYDPKFYDYIISDEEYFLSILNIERNKENR